MCTFSFYSYLVVCIFGPLSWLCTLSECIAKKLDLLGLVIIFLVACLISQYSHIQHNCSPGVRNTRCNVVPYVRHFSWYFYLFQKSTTDFSQSLLDELDSMFKNLETRKKEDTVSVLFFSLFFFIYFRLPTQTSYT